METNQILFRSIMPNCTFKVVDDPMFGDMYTIQYMGSRRLWFLAGQLREKLNYPTVDAMLAKLKPDYISKEAIPSPMGLNGTVIQTIVSSPGVNLLLMESEGPIPKIYREWVCGEVLQQILTTGRYVDTNNTYARIASGMFGKRNDNQ